MSGAETGIFTPQAAEQGVCLDNVLECRSDGVPLARIFRKGSVFEKSIIAEPGNCVTGKGSIVTC